MAIAVNAVAGAGGVASSLTSGSVSPSGSDRYMFGVATGETAPTDMRSGGSGGTSMTQVGSNASAIYAPRVSS